MTCTANSPSVIYTSSDYGVNWILNTSAPSSSVNWSGLSVSASGEYQTVADNLSSGIYTSTDFGTTWILSPSSVFGNFYYAAVSATGRYQTIVTFSFPGIYISEDFGNTWRLSSEPARRYRSVSMSATGQYQVTVVNFDGTNPGGIYLSSDYGNTWILNSSAPTNVTWWNVSMSANGQYITAVIQNGDVYTCSNNLVTGTAGTEIALGYGAGQVNQGSNAIAIGANAGLTNQWPSSIVINATGNELNASTNSGLFVAPIRILADTGNTLQYDPTTFELSYVAKTFVIQHPKVDSKYLVHACLEGPEAGVYYRGKGTIRAGEDSAIITLPDYANALATEFTINITPIYNKTPRLLNASEIEDNRFQVFGPPGDFHWHVYGKRLSIAVEPDKATAMVRGEGPYKWIG
jgi:hypothetical protein